MDCQLYSPELIQAAEALLDARGYLYQSELQELAGDKMSWCHPFYGWVSSKDNWIEVLPISGQDKAVRFNSYDIRSYASMPSTAKLNEYFIECLIRQRRDQMLVHSYIYYEMSDNLVSDATWAEWAKELQILQNEYPEISRRVIYAEAFADWNASSGQFLPYDNPRIVSIATKLIKMRDNERGKK